MKFLLVLIFLIPISAHSAADDHSDLYRTIINSNNEESFLRRFSLIYNDLEEGLRVHEVNPAILTLVNSDFIESIDTLVINSFISQDEIHEWLVNDGRFLFRQQERFGILYDLIQTTGRSFIHYLHYFDNLSINDLNTFLYFSVVYNDDISVRIFLTLGANPFDQRLYQIQHPINADIIHIIESARRLRIEEADNDFPTNTFQIPQVPNSMENPIIDKTNRIIANLFHLSI